MDQNKPKGFDPVAMDILQGITKAFKGGVPRPVEKPEVSLLPEHEYAFEITLSYTETMPATSRAEAIKAIKARWQEQHHITLHDDEIEIVGGTEYE